MVTKGDKGSRVDSGATSETSWKTLRFFGMHPGLENWIDKKSTFPNSNSELLALKGNQLYLPLDHLRAINLRDEKSFKVPIPH